MEIILIELKKIFRPLRLLLLVALLGYFCFAVSKSQQKAVSLTDTASYPEQITVYDTTKGVCSIDLLFQDYLLENYGNTLTSADSSQLNSEREELFHEMDDSISPLETNLNYGVKMNKEEFIGKQGLLERGEPKITRVGLQIIDRGILREHQDVYVGDQLIGHTTSGTMCPYIGKAVAMALIDKQFSELGQIVEVDVRGRKLKAEVIALPFYKREK